VEQLLQPPPREACAASRAPFWKNPAAWLRDQRLGRRFWVFFTVAFFFDFGFAVYFFLFNLFLLDYRFNERAIGLVNGALTLGSVAGTLPAGWLARRIGLRRLLMVCMTAAPVLGCARTMLMGEDAQIALAFLAGIAMCIWGVCFLPAIAGLTTPENRASAFSLVFSVSIGTSALGGLFCGYLPQWLKMAGYAMQPSAVKRLILLTSCGIAAMALIPLLRLRLPLESDGAETQPLTKTVWQPWKFHPFLLRFLPSMALWAAVLASFTPFANVYLSRDLHIPLAAIGAIFSSAQVIQLCVVLLTPLVFRWLGLVNGIVATQVATAVAMGCLAGTHDRTLAVSLYLSFSAMQWMSSPGLYNLLMTRMPAAERSTASAMTMFCNALVSSFATAGTGILIARFGYPPVLSGIAVLALSAALLFRTLAPSADPPAPLQP
jgi:MFS family permease